MRIKVCELLTAIDKEPEKYEGEKYKVVHFLIRFGRSVRDYKDNCSVEYVKVHNGGLWVDKEGAFESPAFCSFYAEFEEV